MNAPAPGPGPGDLGRLVSCGVPGHAPYPDSDGGCSACLAADEAAEAALETRRRAAITAVRREHGYHAKDLLNLLAREIATDDGLGPVVAVLAILAEREHRRDQFLGHWTPVRNACADWLLAFDERETKL